MKLSLKWRITVNMCLLAVCCTVVAASLSILLLIKNQEGLIERQLKSAAKTLISVGISDYSGLKGFEQVDGFIDDTLKIKKINKIINIYTQRGKLMFSSIEGGHSGLTQMFTPVIEPTFATYMSPSRKYKVLSVPYKAKNKKNYFLQIATPYPLYSETINSAMWQVMLMFCIFSFLALIVANMLSRKLVQPVKHIAEYLNELDPSKTKDWRPQYPGKPGEYLDDIWLGINKLITRVKRYMYTLSRTSRYLAHEIRTPLTIITGEAENILAREDATSKEYKDVIKSSLEEVDRMNRVISAVIKIAKKDQLSYKLIQCDLKDLIDKQVKKCGSSWALNIEWEVPEHDVVGLLDQDLLTQLLDNLLRNAKEHSGSNNCKISLKSNLNDITIGLEDYGTGMPTDLIEALNQNDVSNEKIGIGLTLCQEISSICRFDLCFENKSGGGLKVDITIHRQD